MVTILTILNALNLYLALHYNNTPMRCKELFATLNPADRRPLRFYVVTLWAYFSTAATLVCVLLPMIARFVTNVIGERALDRVSLALAITIELIWLFYALTVFSWRVSGYLYANTAKALRWMRRRAHATAVAYLPKIFDQEQV